MGGRERQKFVILNVVEDCLEALDRMCDWNLDVGLAAVRM